MTRDRVGGPETVSAPRSSVGLRRHPAGTGRAVDAIAVVVVRQAAATLEVAYRLTGDPAALRVPPPTAAARRDGLWRHTCFELFVAAPGAPAYVEYNLSPSGEWAAYRFEAYREGRVDLDLPAPRIERRSGPGSLELESVLPLPPWLAEGPVRLGLAAVVEDSRGGLDYWALRHPATAPDFHHRDAFTVEL